MVSSRVTPFAGGAIYSWLRSLLLWNRCFGGLFGKLSRCRTLLASLCFAVGSFATLFLLRPLLNRGLRKRKLAGKLHPATDKDGSLPTGMDALKGRSALVVKEIDGIEGIGRVAIDGDEWPAKAATTEEKFNVGERIIVTDNESIVLVVAPYPGAQSNTADN